MDAFMDSDIFFFTGILYINPADLGWNPPVASWIDRREVQSEKANLTILFDKYLPSCLDALRTRYRSAQPTRRLGVTESRHPGRFRVQFDAGASGVDTARARAERDSGPKQTDSEELDAVLHPIV